MLDQYEFILLSMVAVLMVAFVMWSLLSSVRRESAFGRRLIGGAVLWIAALTSAAFAWRKVDVQQALPIEREIVNRPIEDPADSYVTSDSCQSCHPSEYATWYASYHRTMTQVAGPDTVVAPFDGRELFYKGQRFVVFRQEDQFKVEMDDPYWRGAPPAPREVFEIVLITGSHHMQIYWHPTGDGRRLGMFTFVWLTQEKEWIPRNSAFLLPPDRTTLSEEGRWTYLCIRCHATHGLPRQHGRTDVDTRVAEFGIACEACHGPGEEHVLANRSPSRRYGFHFDPEKPDATVVEPSRLSATPSSQVCAQCHSVWEFPGTREFKEWDKHGFPYRPGENLAESRVLVLPKNLESDPLLQDILNHEPDYFERSFWSDGMSRVVGDEYNAMIQSPCYVDGDETFSCLSCHSMHQSANDPRPVEEWRADQLKWGMDGNDACLQCHESYADDIAAHTYHETDSKGSLCYNCHMPHTSYGLLKAVRAHQVGSPTVAESLETGRPNACNQCHLDKTLAWTNEHLAKWYEIPESELTEDERTIAASILWTLRGDAGQRALMAWSMKWQPAREASGDAWMAPFVAHLLADPYDAVRFSARRTLKKLPGFEDFEMDFRAPPPDLFDGRNRAIQQWLTGQNGPERVTGAELLIHDDGELNEEVIDRLISEIDKRPIDLAE